MKENQIQSFNLSVYNDNNLAILYSLLVLALATLFVIRIIKMWDRDKHEIHSHEYKNGKTDYYIAKKEFNIFYVPLHGVYASKFDAHCKLIELNEKELKNKKK